MSGGCGCLDGITKSPPQPRMVGSGGSTTGNGVDGRIAKLSLPGALYVVGEKPTPTVRYLVSRGIGKTQQAILDALAADNDPWLTVSRTGRANHQVSERQIRRAVRSLEDRRLVVITKRSTGQRGASAGYGRLVPRPDTALQTTVLRCPPPPS